MPIATIKISKGQEKGEAIIEDLLIITEKFLVTKNNHRLKGIKECLAKIYDNI